MREKLTGCRFEVPVELFVSLTNTDVIKSAYSPYETTAHRVKRRHRGRQVPGWATMALYSAERSFTRLGTPELISKLAAALWEPRPGDPRMVAWNPSWLETRNSGTTTLNSICIT
jgi:hypothetical protein